MWNTVTRHATENIVVDEVVSRQLSRRGDCGRQRSGYRVGEPAYFLRFVLLRAEYALMGIIELIGIRRLCLHGGLFPGLSGNGHPACQDGDQKRDGFLRYNVHAAS